MELTWLELRDFRSYSSLYLEPGAGVNVLVGPNGAGKTNLLEAMAYVTSLRSFRSVPEEAMICEGSRAAIVRAEVQRREGRSVVEIEVPLEGRRRVLVNGQRPARTADLLGHVRAVIFLPDDLDIVKRGPAYRRSFYDDTAVQLWPGAYLDQQEFERALRQRNALLRQSGWQVDEPTLTVWDHRLSQAAGKMMVRRAGVAEVLAGRIGELYGRLAGTEVKLTMRYDSAWGGTLESVSPDLLAEAMRDALRRARKADLERGVTTVGPHRDEPGFALGDRDTRTRSSQGEQRTLALSLRLAAHQAIEEAVGEPPLLLLDDVFSELDMERAGELAGVLPQAQTFITTARKEEVPVRGRLLAVGEGAVW